MGPLALLLTSPHLTLSSIRCWHRVPSTWFPFFLSGLSLSLAFHLLSLWQLRHTWSSCLRNFKKPSGKTITKLSLCWAVHGPCSRCSENAVGEWVSGLMQSDDDYNTKAHIRSKQHEQLTHEETPSGEKREQSAQTFWVIKSNKISNSTILSFY